MKDISPLNPHPLSASTLESKPCSGGKGMLLTPWPLSAGPKILMTPNLPWKDISPASADYIKSFDGPLKTISVTPVILPVYEHINDDFGKIDKVNFAGKLYFLLYDTDIDLIGLTGGSKTNRFGIDFSRNITTNFEIHGEFAFINNQKNRVIDSQGNISESKFDAKSYLLGIRYLTPSDTTFIFEYYRNGTGFTHLEMKDYFTFIDRGYDLFLLSGERFSIEESGECDRRQLWAPQCDARLSLSPGITERTF